jgi:putative ABC transport system permease protein
MNLANTLRISLRLLARDWRGGELGVLAVALVIAVGAVSAVGFFAERVQRGMVRQSAELLGADLLVTAGQPLERAWLSEAAARGLRSAETLEFASVVVRDERLQLSSVRAVTAGYPLRGTLKTAPGLYAPDAPTAEVPAPGTVWAETRLLQQLQAAVGDRIEIGTARFAVARVLTLEPARGGAFFVLAPRVLMNAADVAATGVIQPGSRVTYAALFAGEEAKVTAFHDWLAARASAHHQLRGARAANSTVARAIERVDRYIGLTSLLAVLLAGVAIAMGARRYSQRHYDVSAMLRCLGCTQRDIVRLYVPQLLVLGLAASALGGLVGFAGQAGIHHFMSDFFPVPLPPAGPEPLVLGLVTGLVTLAGFGLAPVLRLKSVPPLRVLRRELAPLPPAAHAVIGAAAAAMVFLLWRHTRSLTLTAAVLGGAAAAAVALGAAAWVLLRGLGFARAGVGVAWRFGFNNLARRPRTSLAQVLAFGLTFLAMALIALVRTDLLATWQQQLPADAPNHFAFNVLPSEVAAVERFFARERVPAQAMYPMVRGRLTEINGAPVTRAVTKEEKEDSEALQRELNLTWSSRLPPDNELAGGAWWRDDKRSRPEPLVSVEERLAKRLGIKLGDRLTFSIGGEAVAAEVASLRKVQWDSFHPNFYMIFPPGVLDSFPATYLTSFYLAPGQKPLLAQLVRAFPAVTVLETDQVLTQVRAVLAQVTAAVEFVLLFVLAAGFAVLAAALAASLDERRHEGALLRALGASRRQLVAGQLAEFAALGLVAGLLAAVGTELIAWLLYTRVFELEYGVKWPVWVATPLAGALLLAAAGWFGTRRLARTSPLVVLRET